MAARKKYLAKHLPDGVSLSYAHGEGKVDAQIKKLESALKQAKDAEERAVLASTLAFQKSGLEFRYKHNYSKALEIVTEALNDKEIMSRCSFNNELMLLRNQSGILYLQEECAKAKESLEESLLFQEKHSLSAWAVPPARYLLARCCQKLGQREEAIEHALAGEEYILGREWKDEYVFSVQDHEDDDRMLFLDIKEMQGALSSILLKEGVLLYKERDLINKGDPRRSEGANLLERLEATAQIETDPAQRGNYLAALLSWHEEVPGSNKLKSHAEKIAAFVSSEDFSACLWLWQAWLHHVWSSALRETDTLPQAIKVAREGIAIARQHSGRSALCLALLYRDIGDAELKAENYTAALDAYWQSAPHLRIYCADEHEEDLLKQHFERMAEAYKELGQDKEAVEIERLAANPLSSLAELEVAEQIRSLVGLPEVKSGISSVRDFCLVQQARQQSGSKHGGGRTLVFLGRPHHGKQYVASIVAKLLFSLGKIDTPELLIIEAERLSDPAMFGSKEGDSKKRLVYIKNCDKFFTGEIGTDKQGDGAKALKNLSTWMDNRQEEGWMVFAGSEAFLSQLENSPYSFFDEIDYIWRFPNYKAEESAEIFANLAARKDYTLDPDFSLPDVLQEIMTKEGLRSLNNSHLEKLLDLAMQHQASRLIKEGNMDAETLNTLCRADLIQETHESREELLDECLSQLDKMTGLKEIKEHVHELAGLMRVRERRSKEGLPNPDRTNNIAFTGAPGTGKTTVARIIAQIMYATGQIQSNRLLEVSVSDLIAGYIGQTAIKTKQVFSRARGGVLFIDEAYMLGGYNQGGAFAEEALAELIKLMEDHRDDTIVIFAGYKKEMKKMLDSNPGLQSRVAEVIHFSSYSSAELQEICKSMLGAAGYTLSPEAEKAIAEPCDKIAAMEEDKCGNARDVRNLVESILVKQASRIQHLPSADLSLVTDEDIVWEPRADDKKKHKLGFA